jgi:hypothetical protein
MGSLPVGIAAVVGLLALGGLLVFTAPGRRTATLRRRS